MMLRFGQNLLIHVTVDGGGTWHGRGTWLIIDIFIIGMFTWDCWYFVQKWVEFASCGLDWDLSLDSMASIFLSDSFSWHENTRSALLSDLSSTVGVLGGFLAASSQRSSKNSFLPESWSGSSQSNWRNQILWLLVSITAPKHLQTLLEMRNGVFDSTIAILIQNLSIGTKMARLHGTTLLFPKRKDMSTGFSWTKLRTWGGKWLKTLAAGVGPWPFEMHQGPKFPGSKTWRTRLVPVFVVKSLGDHWTHLGTVLTDWLVGLFGTGKTLRSVVFQRGGCTNSGRITFPAAAGWLLLFEQLTKTLNDLIIVFAFMPLFTLFMSKNHKTFMGVWLTIMNMVVLAWVGCLDIGCRVLHGFHHEDIGFIFGYIIHGHHDICGLDLWWHIGCRTSQGMTARAFRPPMASLAAQSAIAFSDPHG